MPLHRLRQHRARPCSLAASVGRPDDRPRIGARSLRNEDARLLTGRALFVDDVRLPGMLHVAFLRSDHAHAPSASRRRHGRPRAAGRGRGLHRRRPRRLLAARARCSCRRRRSPGMVFHERTQVPLAKDKVRHVGEPIAMVVAESRYVAEDALADIVVDVEPLAAVVDLEAALAARRAAASTTTSAPTSPPTSRQRKGDYAGARAARRPRHPPPLPLRPRRRARRSRTAAWWRRGTRRARS